MGTTTSYKVKCVSKINYPPVNGQEIGGIRHHIRIKQVPQNACERFNVLNSSLITLNVRKICKRHVSHQPQRRANDSELLTGHQILEFSIELLCVVALLCVAAIIQFQYNSQHYPSRIRNNSSSRFAQATAFRFVICPRNLLAIAIAVVHVLAAGTLEHFSAVS